MSAFRFQPSRLGCRSATRRAQHTQRVVVRATQEGPSTSVQDSWELLTEFNKADVRGLAGRYLDTPEKRSKLREAVLEAYTHPRPEVSWAPGPQADVLLGIVASDVHLGVRALRDWTEALKLPFMLPVSRVPDVANIADVTGSIYIKFNYKTDLCYVSKYQGRDRGVLLQMGGAQVGHLPLGMFDEQQTKPAVPLTAEPESSS